MARDCLQTIRVECRITFLDPGSQLNPKPPWLVVVVKSRCPISANSTRRLVYACLVACRPLYVDAYVE